MLSMNGWYDCYILRNTDTQTKVQQAIEIQQYWILILFDHIITSVVLVNYLIKETN